MAVGKRLPRIDGASLAIEIPGVLSPLQLRIATIVGVIAFVVIFVVPEFLKDSDAPLQPGDRLLFAVTETSPSKSKAYLLRVILHKRPAGFLEVEVRTEHGDRLVRVDRKLRPVDATDQIEFPLALGGFLDPGALWLPSEQRVLDSISLGGYVKRVTSYKAFKALEVEAGPDNFRYYELDTGLLLGFERKDPGGREVAGTLMSLR